MEPRGRNEGDQAALLITALCAVIGGLLASMLAAGLWTVSPWRMALITILGAALSTALAFFVLAVDRPDPSRAAPRWHAMEQPPYRPETSQPRPSPPPAPTPVAARTAPRPEPAKVVVPLPGAAPAPAPTAPSAPGAGRQWWTERTPGAAQPEAREPQRPPAPALSSYEPARAVVAQCPRCGEFRLDLRAVPGGYAFQCLVCGNAWDWAPGTPWPAVVVRRNLAGPPRADGTGPEHSGTWR